MPTPPPLPYRALRLHPSLMMEPLPPVLNFEVTNHCNLRCSHCGHSQHTPFVKGHAPEGLFEKLMPYLGKDKIPSLGVSGFGESLLSSQWWSIFSRARSIPDLRISFITNAVLLDRHLNKLDYPHLDIAISMDGASEPTYSHFRGHGYFEKVVRNLSALRDKEARGTLPPSNRTFIVVLSQVNVHEMRDLVELAARLGVSTVIFTFQVFFDMERFRKESLYFAPASYDRWLRIARQQADLRGIALLHPDSFDGTTTVEAPGWNRGWLWRDEAKRIRCGMVSNNCYVTYHGQVEACCLPDRHIVGNLEEDDFLEVWYGHYYRRLRHSFLTGRWTPACHNCNIFQAVDVHREQSHFLTPVRDDGRLHSFPQPYRVTQLDREYRRAIQGLTEGAEPGRVMPVLQQLILRDGEFHEAMNALGAAWATLGRSEQANTMLKSAAAVEPDDPIVKHNLSLLSKVGDRFPDIETEARCWSDPAEGESPSRNG